MSKRIIFFIGFIILISLSAFAQESKRSEIIKWIDGQKFYIHTVTQGQGLYSIKKIYGVEEKDILENNTEAFDGLKLGQELKIPFIKQKTEVSTYRIHIIAAGESIYSISKQYDVSTESIFALNPEVQNGYKINQKLKIPLKEEKLVTTKDDAEDSEDKKTYKVKKKDTLYSLARKFGVTEDALVEANSIIAKEGLKKGQKIIIPGKEIIIKEALYIPLDTMYYNETSILDNHIPCDSAKYDRHTPMNVALFLPFEIDKSVFNNELEKNTNQKPKFSEKPFLEFYQGFLMAIEKLKSQGKKLNLHVFNTKRDSNEVKRLLTKGIIKDLDLIIGPVYEQNFTIVQKATDSLSIPMINPIIKGTNVSDNSKSTIDMFANNKVITQQTIKLLLQNDSSQIFFVHSGFVDDLIISEPFKKMYLNALLEAGKDTTDSYKEIIFSESKKIDFNPFLNKDKHNLVVILSDNQAFVSNVFSKLNIQTDNFEVQLVARPKWLKFDNIDVSYYHNLNTILITSEFIDYKQKEVISFVKDYRTFYNIEPSKYAFFAYDLTYNFTDYFYKYQTLRCLKEYPFSNLIFGTYFKQSKKGILNHSVFVVHYKKDYSVEKEFQINEKLIELETVQN